MTPKTEKQMKWYIDPAPQGLYRATRKDNNKRITGTLYADDKNPCSINNTSCGIIPVYPKSLELPTDFMITDIINDTPSRAFVNDIVILYDESNNRLIEGEIIANTPLILDKATKSVMGPDELKKFDNIVLIPPDVPAETIKNIYDAKKGEYNHLKVFAKDSKEYRRLKQVVTLLNAISKKLRFTIETVYYDFGANWKYTTIIANDPTITGILSNWQALSSQQQRKIIMGSFTDCKTVIRELLGLKTEDEPIEHTACTTKEQICSVMQCLIDNGIDESEADIVAEALYFIMKDEDIEPLL